MGINIDIKKVKEEEEETMKKKILALVVASLMILAITGCSSKDGEAADTGAAGEDDVIKIGVLEDLSGDFSLVGQQKLHAAELAVEEINEAGGLLGKR
jgi:branched-chain amino acid transport system substrate-binding protein